MTNVKLGNYRIGSSSTFLLIAGPCVIESEESAMRHAKYLVKLTQKLNMPFVFKTSFDKANRSSIESYRGPGLRKGLEILKSVKKETGALILSDIHTPDQAERAGEILDVIQIPALLSRQTDLIVEAAKTGKVVNVKKGQFMAPDDMKNVCDKILKVGNNKILLTDRGTSFGYHTLVSDLRSLIVMRDIGFPVIYDATHSIQQPSACGKVSGGEWKYAPALARAAVAVGCDGLFIEVHEDPSKALSDGPAMIPLKLLPRLLSGLKQLNRITRKIS